MIEEIRWEKIEAIHELWGDCNLFLDAVEVYCIDLESEFDLTDLEVGMIYNCPSVLAAEEATIYVPDETPAVLEAWLRYQEARTRYYRDLGMPS